MVASSDDIDVSAVVCLGYPLKVPVVPLSSWSAYCFFVPLYLNILFYWVKLLNWCPDKKWIYICSKKKWIYISFVAWLGQMMVAVSLKWLLLHPLATTLQLYELTFCYWRCIPGDETTNVLLFSTPTVLPVLGTWPWSRCLLSLSPMTRNLYWIIIKLYLRNQFSFHLILLYPT
jgi:hypothetical protein